MFEFLKIRRASMIQQAEKRMVQMLKSELGIEIIGIRIVSRNESIISISRDESHIRIPCLYLLMAEDEYNKILDTPDSRRTEILNDEIRNKVIMVWLKVIRETGLSPENYYDNAMQIGTTNVDRRYYTEFARTQKAQIRDYLVKKLHTGPRDVYASSLPGVSIVYETDDYIRLKIDECQDELTEGIRKMAEEYVRKKYGYVPCVLSVWFYHPGMAGYNGYGLARED